MDEQRAARIAQNESIYRAVNEKIEDLNRAYREEPALHELDADTRGFEWIDANDAQNSVVSFLRRGSSTEDLILVAANFTPVPRYG